MSWQPPGKNCGLCGLERCEAFREALVSKQKEAQDCPFFRQSSPESDPPKIAARVLEEQDILGNPFDFVLTPLPGEISARKIVLPFRGDLVEKLAIQKGDIVMGRPMGAGCPIPHVLQVIEADSQTGLLVTWVVGPAFSRERAVKDVTAYHMIGFEGMVSQIRKNPEFGRRVTFLPGFCMMNLNHTGLVNLLLEKNAGLQIRIEDIRILAS